MNSQVGDNITGENSELVLSCQDLKKTFTEGPARVEVLKSISLNIKKGEQVAIIGASGSGKSTLLHLLGGLDVPSGGTISIAGQDMSKLDNKQRGILRNRHMGFVYQFHHLLPEFTAIENVAMPLFIRRESIKYAMEKASEILAKVGLEHRLRHKPSELSGGERQRAAIARALVTRPDCVLADEPTGNLDVTTAEHVHQEMLLLNREQATSFVVVTHDPKLAEKMDRVLEIKDGVIK